jgi:hypothetical protein
LLQWLEQEGKADAVFQVGLNTQGNGDWVAAGITEYAEANGINLVGTELSDPAETNWLPLIQKIKDSGATSVIIVALVWVARRGAPRLSTAGALLSLPAFLTAFFVLGGPQPAVLAARYDLDLDAVGSVADAAENDPTILVVGLVFLIGIVFGLPVLGIALWRSRASSFWAAAALVLGAGTHPFVPGHIGQGFGLLVAATGFAAASVALLRTPNVAFDLPPVAPGSGGSGPTRPVPEAPAADPAPS